MRFASFLSGEFVTVIVVNPPERRLAKRTSVQSTARDFAVDERIEQSMDDYSQLILLLSL